jgi:hypothetical protein
MKVFFGKDHQAQPTCACVRACACVRGNPGVRVRACAAGGSAAGPVNRLPCVRVRACAYAQAGRRDTRARVRCCRLIAHTWCAAPQVRTRHVRAADGTRYASQVRAGIVEVRTDPNRTVPEYPSIRVTDLRACVKYVRVQCVRYCVREN